MMKILVFLITMIIAVLPIVNAQPITDKEEIFIEQTPVSFEVSYNAPKELFVQILQLNSADSAGRDLSYSEHNDEVIEQTARINSWKFLSEAAKEAESCSDGGGCISESVDAYSNSHAMDREFVAKSAGKYTNDGSVDQFEIKSTGGELPFEDEAVMEVFRKAFEVALKEQDEKKENERTSMLEIDGMVHDETRSKVGRDFYDLFYSFWESPPEARNFTIRVVEAPGPNPGTMVFVMVNQEEVVKIQLQPGDDRIRKAGVHAVRKTYEYLEGNTGKQIIY